MQKIKDNLTNTIIINKSKFITSIFRVTSLLEINEILALTRKKYYDATHNCYAYIFDNGQKQKCSDDGEPAKTAGAPMLDCLKKNDLTDVLAITTRYFGGIKLGAGGLIRAYSSSVSEALKLATFVETKKLKVYEVKLDYQSYNKLTDFLSDKMVKNINYASDVSFEIAFFENDLDTYLEQIKNLTFGKALVNYLKDEYLDVKISA